MKFQMKKCKNCNEYTLKDTCPICHKKTGVIFPARYSPEDKYGKYRRMLKKENMEKTN